jgi:hypothetical protein
LKKSLCVFERERERDDDEGQGVRRGKRREKNMKKMITRHNSWNFGMPSPL